MDLSLMFFSNATADNQAAYELILDAARYADEQQFSALWLPERHFHSFGGLHPNPSVLAAALTTITKQIHLRAGSVVSPLHDIVRVAEEWSVVDNLSKGRIGLSFASGWQQKDFVFYPHHFQNRFSLLYEQIEQFQQLWSGQSMLRGDSTGEPVAIYLWPKPYSSTVPIWVSVAANVESYQKAGELGYNILTHMVEQNVTDLARNIQAYKAARKDGSSGKITLMLHTFVHSDLGILQDRVEIPFKNYLRTILRFGGVKARHVERAAGTTIDVENQLIDMAYQRYLQTASLIGTPEHCRQFMQKLVEIGVTEIACLIDFGVEAQFVFESLKQLKSILVQ